MNTEHLDSSTEVRTALGICTPESKGLSETEFRNSAAANPICTDEPKPSAIHTPIRESEAKLQPQQAVSARTNRNHQPSTRQFTRAKPNSSPSKPVPHERTQTIRHPCANSRERSQTPVQQAIPARTNPNHQTSTHQFTRANPNSSPRQALSARTNPNYQASTPQFTRANPNSSPQQAISARTNPNIRHRQYQFTQAKP
jgi:hypothetical protein